MDQNEQPLTEAQIREEKIRSRLADRVLIDSGAVTPGQLQRTNSVFSLPQIQSFKYDFAAWRKHLVQIHVVSESETSSRS